MNAILTVRDTAVKIEGAFFRGSIDLVEGEAGGGKVRVTDHKTGRPARISRPDTDKKLPVTEIPVVIGGGQLLQPVFYALAAEQLFVEAPSGTPRIEPRSDSAGNVGKVLAPKAVRSGRLFYCTQKGGYEVVEVELDQKARDAAREVIQVVDGAIEEGFLPAAPLPGACKFCDYQRVCGPNEELRTGRKPKKRLEALTQLRKHE